MQNAARHRTAEEVDSWSGVDGLQAVYVLALHSQ